MNLTNVLAFPLCLFTVLAGGCSPATLAVKVGMFTVGKIVNDIEADELEKKLIGQPVTAADAELGARKDTFRQVNGPAVWVSYPTKLDILNKNQFFVEILNDRIVRIEKMEGSTGEVEIARSAFQKLRVAGKTPSECQEILDAGPPQLVVRSDMTGNLIQFYDGKLIAEIGNRKLIILHFDSQQKCEKLQIVDVTSTVG